MVRRVGRLWESGPWPASAMTSFPTSTPPVPVAGRAFGHASTVPVRTAAPTCVPRWEAIARMVEPVAYEPKMNVTPNTVATKD